MSLQRQAHQAKSIRCHEKVIPVRFLSQAALCSLLLVSSISGAEHGSRYRVQDQVSLDYNVERKVVTLHEPIVLFFTVHNEQAKRITLNLGGDRNEFHELSVKTPEGKIRRSGPLSGGGLSRIGTVVIQPGGEYQQELLLNQWFRFDSIGTYVVTAQPRTNVDIGEFATLQSPNYSAEIEVRPRDVERLRTTCSNLANQVEAASDATAARQPALVLSYIEDPVAVPYLSQILLARKLTEYAAVAGLERIGNAEAITVLVSALDNPYDDIASSARMALRRLEGRPSDPVLRHKIKQALAKVRATT